MPTYQTSNKTIRTPFPEEFWSKIKTEVNIQGEKFSEEQIKRIYVLVVDAFLGGDISTDAVAGICNKMFDKVVQIKGKDDSDLLQAIIAGSELAFYIRNQNLLIQFNGFLKDVIRYADDFRK